VEQIDAGVVVAVGFPVTVEVEEIVVKAARSLRDIGVQKSIMNESILRENLTATMAEVLAQNSTIFIKSSGRATLSTASLRGTAPSHTAVSWNGIEPSGLGNIYEVEEVNNTIIILRNNPCNIALAPCFLELVYSAGKDISDQDSDIKCSDCSFYFKDHSDIISPGCDACALGQNPTAVPCGHYSEKEDDHKEPDRKGHARKQLAAKEDDADINIPWAMETFLGMN
jgi:hypothetical protein